MLIKEFRIVLPLTVEEYQIAQLWSVAESSKENTGGGEGIEIIANEPFANKLDLFKNYTSGQYSHKLYKLQSKVPWWLKKLSPKNSLEVHEKAWNAYPYCQTTITNEYMKDNFFIKIESFHSTEKGEIDNVFELSKDQLKKREIVRIDIANDRIHPSDYSETEDPTKFLSKKTGRGLLLPNWQETTQYYMCAYKLCTIEFKWFGLQGKIEKFLQNSERRLFTKFHRQIFCWIDKWYGLTMEDIRKVEMETKKVLEQQINTGYVRGMKSVDE